MTPRAESRYRLRLRKRNRKRSRLRSIVRATGSFPESGNRGPSLWASTATFESEMGETSHVRVPPGERIERTHYGGRQHGTVSSDEAIHYGDPQHDPEKLRPEQVARLGYEDFHWGADV